MHGRETEGAELISESDPRCFYVLHISYNLTDSLHWLCYTSLQRMLRKTQRFLISQELSSDTLESKWLDLGLSIIICCVVFYLQ